MVVCGKKTTIDQALINQQFGVNTKQIIDVTNVLVKEAQIAFKKIARLNAFVTKKHWNII